MGKCMGVDALISVDSHPRCLDPADHDLASRLDVDVLDRDLQLALAALAVQRRNIAGRSFRRPTRDERDERST